MNEIYRVKIIKSRNSKIIIRKSKDHTCRRIRIFKWRNQNRFLRVHCKSLVYKMGETSNT